MFSHASNPAGVRPLFSRVRGEKEGSRNRCRRDISSAAWDFPDEGKDKWRSPAQDTKVTGLKVGSKVTIEYRMTATMIEVKDAKAKETKKK